MLHSLRHRRVVSVLVTGHWSYEHGGWVFDNSTNMTDLTFCYLHMTSNDLQVIDTVGTLEYLKGDLSDDEMDIPPHMIPPNPDDSDILPSHVHPSYPYGDPTNIKHPAARPRVPYDPTSRALFEDMGYAGGGANGTLRWKDLALDILLPVDYEKEEAEKAAQARKMASGTASNHHQTAQQAPEDTAMEEEDVDDENDENENDENNDDDEEDGMDGDDAGDEEGGQSEDRSFEQATFVQ